MKSKEEVPIPHAPYETDSKKGDGGKTIDIFKKKTT